MGKHGFGWDSDMSKFGPKAHLGSAIINWAPYYKVAVQDVLDGKWETKETWWGHKEGVIDLVSLSDAVPVDAATMVDEIKKGLRAGTFEVFKGPIVDQEGKTVLEEGTTADNKLLLGMNFYVKGVDGKIPSGN
jgi:simple sugar transport system substrate-binding protein